MRSLAVTASSDGARSQAKASLSSAVCSETALLAQALSAAWTACSR